MEDSLISKLGSATESIERPQDEQTRKDIDNLAKDRNQDAHIRLRAFLSIGKIPPPELTTEANISAALKLDDQVNFLPKLAPNMKLINADAPFRAILGGMKDVGARRAVRITWNLGRATAKWRKQLQVVAISENSVQLFLQILEELAKYQLIDQTKPRLGPAKKKNQYFQMLGSGTRWTLISSTSTSLLLLLKALSSTEEHLATPIEELIDDVEFRNSFQDVISRTIDHCEHLVKIGAISEFNEWAAVISKLSAAKANFSRSMAKLYSDRARLPESSQDALKIFLGDDSEAPLRPMMQLDDEDSLRTVQLASALVAAWVAREDGPRASDVFEELRSVAGNFFNLQLHEKVGSTEEYNPRIHELILGAKSSNRVRLLGPWVEYSRQNVSKVILKAPVEPA